jgi:hypothetical protein
MPTPCCCSTISPNVIPALAHLAAAAVSGLPPAGPELRRKPLKLTLPTGSGPKIVRPLCVDDGGFSLHAATRAGAEDQLGRENLFKYVLNHRSRRSTSR